jgi:hypothetical protein
MCRVTRKTRVQVALVGRRFLLASKLSYKRRDLSLNSHTAMGLTRILLLMSRAPAAAQKLSQTSKTLSKGLTKACEQENERRQSLRLPRLSLTYYLFCLRSRHPPRSKSLRRH